MTLSKEHLNILSDAIKGYSFPHVYFDFLRNCPLQKPDMLSVEDRIRDDLLSGNPDLVKNGLSNVLYWGFAQVGYRDRRVELFRTQITQGQLYDAAQLFSDMHDDGLREIKQIGLPQFSGMSFISKVRMFLDPDNYVVLDQQILKMNTYPRETLLKNIAFGPKETQIRISENNCQVYLDWCKKCRDISIIFYKGEHRAVEIERGFFTLIQRGQGEIATEILSRA